MRTIFLLATGPESHWQDQRNETHSNKTSLVILCSSYFSIHHCRPTWDSKYFSGWKQFFCVFLASYNVFNRQGLSLAGFQRKGFLLKFPCPGIAGRRCLPAKHCEKWFSADPAEEADWLSGVALGFLCHLDLRTWRLLKAMTNTASTEDVLLLPIWYWKTKSKTVTVGGKWGWIIILLQTYISSWIVFLPYEYDIQESFGLWNIQKRDDSHFKQ